MKRIRKPEGQRPKKEKKPLRERFGGNVKKRFFAGGYSLAALFVVIAIAVMVNLMALSLPSSSTQIDLTDQGLFTLSDQSKRVAAALQNDVTLYLLANKGYEDETVKTLLDRYAGLSSRITVSYIDPTEQPTFLDRYDLDISQLYANSVLVESGDKVRLVGFDEIFVTSYEMDPYGYGYTTSTSFEGENALTNAIHYVSRDDLPRVYTLTGHGEAALADSVKTLVERDNLELESLSLVMLDAVPEDASAIVIHAPTRDLSEAEADLLIAYLNGGGSVVMMTDYMEAGSMKNLLRVAESMGMTVGDGLIVEGDRNMHLSRYAYYLLPDMASHAVTAPLVEGGYFALLPMAQPIEQTGTSGATVTPLMTTSALAYSKQAGLEMTTTEKEDGDVDGPFTVAAASQNGEAKMLLVTSPGLLDESVNALVSGANSDLFVNSLGWMCGQEETISIRAKTMDGERLTLTGSQTSLWSIVLVGIVPGALILVGIVVSIRRKRR